MRTSIFVIRTLLLVSFSTTVFLSGCKKHEAPTVTTNEVKNINCASADGSGTISSDGGSPITACGLLLSTSNPMPDLLDDIVISGTGSGTFTIHLNLVNNSTYYMRAFASNLEGTCYGNVVSFNISFDTILTMPITNITNHSAIGGGQVADFGGWVTKRGVCWSTTPHPLVTDNYTTDGTGTGKYVSNLNGLTENTLYYIRAYTTYDIRYTQKPGYSGTSYGEELAFQTLGPRPNITTDSVYNITQTTATCGGSVTSEGDATVTSRGVCWGTSSNPIITGNHTTDGTGPGMFISSLTGLTMSTTYYIRAFASNNFGTIYGQEDCFTTMSDNPCGSTLIINHLAGAVAPVTKTVTYKLVRNIPGERTKCWITSNLGSDHQANSVSDATEASAGWYWQFNRKQGFKHDGSLRTPNTTWLYSIVENSDWTSVNDPCSIELGTGWRLPTYTEWRNVGVGGDWIKYNDPWNSGLKLHAAGFLFGSLTNRGSSGHYWSSAAYNSLYGLNQCFQLGYIQLKGDEKAYGGSIRCLKD